MNVCLDCGIHFPQKFDYNTLETYHRLGNMISRFVADKKSPETSDPEGKMKQFYFRQSAVENLS